MEGSRQARARALTGGVRPHSNGICVLYIALAKVERAGAPLTSRPASSRPREPGRLSPPQATIVRRVGPSGAARTTRRRPPPRGPSLAAAKLTFQHRSLSLSSSWLGSVVEFGPQAAYSPKSAS